MLLNFQHNFIDGHRFHNYLKVQIKRRLAMSNCARTLAQFAVVGAAFIASIAPVYAQTGNVNVYTYRERGLIQPLFDIFTKETGIKVNVISAGSGLEQRIKTEGA